MLVFTNHTKIVSRICKDVVNKLNYTKRSHTVLMLRGIVTRNLLQKFIVPQKLAAHEHNCFVKLLPRARLLLICTSRRPGEITGYVVIVFLDSLIGPGPELPLLSTAGQPPARQFLPGGHQAPGIIQSPLDIAAMPDFASL